VPADLNELRLELSRANRILAHEGVLDAFGHVSARHPDNPNRYFLSRSRAPELVEPSDFLEFDLDSNPVRPPNVPLYSERVIHGEIYKARPDVMSVCHHHAPAFMPLCITGTDYVPVFHLGAIGGFKPPFWDQRDEFGDTNLLVVKPEEGASLAKALGQHSMVLMNRHGVTVVGTSVKQDVFRCYYSCRNAEYQVQSQQVGKIDPLSAGEIERCAAINTQTTGLARAWEYWVARLAKRNADPTTGGGAKRAAAKRVVAPKRAKTAKAAKRPTKGRKGK
jgi:HCOMODA/2-hydroxy-3-carboxy-muconic semialdehyde decarboxylase